MEVWSDLQISHDAHLCEMGCHLIISSQGLLLPSDLLFTIALAQWEESTEHMGISSHFQ